MSKSRSASFVMSMKRVILALVVGGLVMNACKSDDAVIPTIGGSEDAEKVVVTEEVVTEEVGVVVTREVLGADYRGGFMESTNRVTRDVEVGVTQEVETEEVEVEVTKEVVGGAWASQCGPGPFHGPRARLPEEYLHWTGGIGQLVFGYDEIIWSVDVASSEIEAIVDVNPGYRTDYGDEYFGVPYGLYGDVSPDGTKIVYASCEFPTEYVASDAVISDMVLADRYEDRERGKYTYEIATIGINGENPERITANIWLDHYPSWSPDGSRIAFISNLGDPGRSVFPNIHGLYTMAADGSDVREIVAHPRRPGDIAVALSPPVWSPDGRRLAFYAPHGEAWPFNYVDRPFNYVLYTVRVDGTELHRVGETSPLSKLDDRLPPPSWSPDGTRLAFVMGRDSIYTARADGTELRQIARGYRSRQVAWSPASDEIVFLVDGQPHSVSPGGGNGSVRPWPLPDALRIRFEHVFERLSSALSRVRSGTHPVQVAWSPDGSQIAIYIPGQMLVTIDHEGADHRVVLEGDVRVAWRAQTDGQRGQPVDVSACSAGLVVPEPEQNPWLVFDCQTLLRSIEVLAGSADFRWSTDQPITKWSGVDFTHAPYRVRELDLVNLGLAGTIPLELLNLGELVSIDLYRNPLHGCVPQELLEHARILTGMPQEGQEGGLTDADMLAPCRPAGVPNL